MNMWLGRDICGIHTWLLAIESEAYAMVRKPYSCTRCKASRLSAQLFQHATPGGFVVSDCIGFLSYVLVAPAVQPD